MSISKRLGGNDQRTLAFYIVGTLLIGVIGILAAPMIQGIKDGPDVVDQYTAVLSPDGILRETFVYDIKSIDTRMLYRYWEEELHYQTGGTGKDNIVLLSLTAPGGSVGYVKDCYNNVHLIGNAYPDSAAEYTIFDLAYRNEAGSYSKYYLNPGSYEISYIWKLNFIIDSDGVTDHLNLMLADQHILYRNVRIVLEDAGYLKKVYQHPPSLTRSVEGNDIVFTGSSGLNEMLEIEMLMTSGEHEYTTFLSGDSDIMGLTEQANRDYYLQYWTAYRLGTIAKAAVIITPLILLGYYLRYGVEEDVTVPPSLSTVPNKDRKPWVVNLVFEKGVYGIDKNAFYATLLDLDKRKKISIEPKGEGLKIHILETDSDDNYEKKVLDLLTGLSTMDPTSNVKVLDTDTLSLIEKNMMSGTTDAKATLAENELPALTQYHVEIPLSLKVFMGIMIALSLGVWFSNLQYMDPDTLTTFILLFGGISALIFGGRWIESRRASENNYTKTKRMMKETANTFIVSGGKRLKYLMLIGGFILLTSAILYQWAPITTNLLFTPVTLGFIAIAQVVIAIFSPPTLFGTWKPGMYREKLEWDAFRNHLSDYAQLSKYSTEDLSMWGSWLIYGTALGVGDKIAQAMSSLNIQYTPAIVATSAHKHFNPLITTSIVASSGGGGGGGGRRKGGGGKGGGGGRGRGGGGRR